MIQRGVMAGLPTKTSSPDWKPIADSITQLPQCWIRESMHFHELCWEPNKFTNWERLEAVLKLTLQSKKKLMLVVVPCPHPTAEGWNKRVGGPWPWWWRPDFRIWEPIHETLQMAIDRICLKWFQLGGSKSSLVFEWFNEPATGHVAGGDPSREPKGMWSAQFHSFCNYLLIDNGGINWHGHKVVGATLSMFGQPEPERVELSTASGGDDGYWWTAMHRRCVNLGIYLPTPVQSPEEAASQYRKQLEVIMAKMANLDLPVPKSPLRVHEWYVTKPMLGYHNGACSDTLRRECMEAIGAVIKSYKDIEAAFFFAHHYNPPDPKSLYEQHSAFSGPARQAMVKFLREP